MRDDDDCCFRRLTNDVQQRSLVEEALRLRRDWLRVNFSVPRFWGDVRLCILRHLYGEDARRLRGNEELWRMGEALNLIERTQPPRVAVRSSQRLTAAEREFLRERGLLHSYVTDAEEEYLRENDLGLG